MTDAKAVATKWLKGLAARGVSVTVAKGRLRMHPSTAYKQLTDRELITLRRHRQAIKDVISDGVTFTVVHAAPTTELAPFVEPTPMPCPYCGVHPCIGPDNREAYRALHWNDPQEVARREREATAVMMHTMFRRSPYL